MIFQYFEVDLCYFFKIDQLVTVPQIHSVAFVSVLHGRHNQRFEEITKHWDNFVTSFNFSNNIFEQI